MSDKFLDLYKTLDPSHITEDVDFATYSMELGVLPSTVRYGIMQRGPMVVYRGVVKSTGGEDFYFSWSPGADFRLIEAQSDNDKWEIQKLYKTCTLGFDLRKSEEPKQSAPKTEDNEDEEKGGFPNMWPAGTASLPEDRMNTEQQQVDVHPGAAQGTTPDSPFVGNDWHAEKSILTNGQSVWSKLDLIKGLGYKLQETAPTVQTKTDALEVRYLKEVMGATDQQISKGYSLPARHKIAYESWKGSQLHQNLTKLQQWTRKKGE